MARRKVGGSRRKSTPRKKTRTRRRISGTGKLNLQGLMIKVAGLGAGAVSARLLNTIVVKQFPSFSPLLSGGVQIAAGVILPMLVKGSKFVADMGDGMIANGVMVEVVNLGIISGMGDGSTVSYRISGTNRRGLSTMAGPRNLSTMAGASQLSTMAGHRRNRGGSSMH